MKETECERKRLEGLIHELESGIEKAKDYGRKMQDPALYDQFKAEALDVFVQKIKEMQLP